MSERRGASQTISSPEESWDESEMHQDYRRQALFKESGYVRVELRANPAGQSLVSKQYLAHTRDDQRRNAAYSFRALKYFKEHFSDVLVSPEPVAQRLEEGEILMEYLPELTKAKRLTFGTIGYARSFFDRCYTMGPATAWIESIYGSVVSTPRLREIMDSGCPLGIGLKCDFYENLRFFRGRVILADVEGLAYEPRGLSELVLHASLIASATGGTRIFSYPAQLIPVAFETLSRDWAASICGLAIEMFSNSMTTVHGWRKTAKSALAEAGLRKARDNFYRAER